VLGLPDNYSQTFPGVIRVLSGSGTGVLLYQQTASNLHAAAGDTVTINPVEGKLVIEKTQAEERKPEPVAP